MTATLSKVMLYAALPAVAILAGALLTLIKQPSAGFRSAVQHFAAGTVFSVLAVELLPDLMHRRLPWPTFIGFSLGVAFMLGLKWWSERGGGAEEGRNPGALLTALGVDVVLDGLLIGLSFAAGEKQGLLLTIGLMLETFFLGASCATSLRNVGQTSLRIGITGGILGIGVLAGAGAGAVILNSVTPVFIDALLAFGVAALLYLVTEEILVEAHEGKETPGQTAMFFLGFILLFMIDMLI